MLHLQSSMCYITVISAMMVTAVSVLHALPLVPLCQHMGVITAQPFSSRRGEEGMLKVHRVLLTFPFCLTMKSPPVKLAGFVLAQHSCYSVDPAELLKEAATCKEVPCLKGTRRKIIQLPPSVKTSRQIPSHAYNFYHPSRLHRPQSAHQNTHQYSIMAICDLAAWEKGRSVTVKEDCSGCLHDQGTVSSL